MRPPSRWHLAMLQFIGGTKIVEIHPSTLREMSPVEEPRQSRPIHKGERQLPYDSSWGDAPRPKSLTWNGCLNLFGR